MSGAGQGRTYPRTWYRVSRHSLEPQAQEFIRETENKLVYKNFRGRDCFESKTNNYASWYPTLEEAKAALADYRAKAEAALKTRARIAAAAPELLEAASEAFDFLGGVDGAAEIRAKLLAAIAKAEGGAA